MFAIKEFFLATAYTALGAFFLTGMFFFILHVLTYEDQPTAAEIYARDSEELLEERIRAAREADEDRAGLEEPFSN